MYPDFYTTFGPTFKILGFLMEYSLYWLPFLFAYLFLFFWYDYLRLENISKTKWCLLGLRLPNNILKTPLSMELVLSAMHQTSEGNWFERWWTGKHRPWFSLELVSIGGEVRFYIRTVDKFKNYIEAQIYSQFPGIEIFDAEDYTHEIPDYEPGGEWEMWGTEFGLTKADPYPIKTYVDYKLDQQIKKEEELSTRTDPFMPTIEFLGSIGKNERIWVQILIQATHKRFKDPKSWFGFRDWKGEAKDILSKLQDKGEGEKMSRAESEAAAAIEREISKFGFDCGIRVIYMGRDGAFSPLNISGCVGMMKHYNSEILNGFKPKNATGADEPWQQIFYTKKKTTNVVSEKKRILLKAYRHRGFFYPPYKKKPFVLNTEELATIYHFPGGLLSTPGFETISSHKAEPPSNLPI